MRVDVVGGESRDGLGPFSHKVEIVSLVNYYFLYDDKHTWIFLSERDEREGGSQKIYLSSLRPFVNTYSYIRMERKEKVICSHAQSHFIHPNTNFYWKVHITCMERNFSVFFFPICWDLLWRRGWYVIQLCFSLPSFS